MRDDLGGLKALGKTVRVAMDYDPSVLDAFANKHPERDYWVTFTAPEFTTLCPKTGQPDLAKLLKPKYMEVYGKFAARGGISIDPFVNGGTGRYRTLAVKRFAEWKGVRD